MRCPACGGEAPDGVRFCPHCAAELAGAGAAPDAPTELSPERPPRPGDAGSGAAGGRFLPGATVAGRFRIVSLLGRGGMGEVYRADDLKLGQTVALKFLPERMAGDEEWLRRFLDEVNVARRVSHPNVCRVYDVGEVGGHHFLSMEYIDGEDLGSLLRRIGRLPQDKAVEIGRQICAGLAACHDQGVLHRDLKPANVMIDGRGSARLTDFGLAAAGEVERGDIGSGTPAFMAPEQLAGHEVTVRSDLYALGLVLYEIFTGRRAVEGDSVAEISRRQAEDLPSRPSSLVEGLDPAVERVILRCLEKEPRDRPAAALEVSAALPGGDPLAAALAAGETPSPELVAAAGERGSLTPRAGGLLLAGLAVGLVALAGLAGRYQVTAVLPMDKPRDVLIERAREIVAAHGGDSGAVEIADTAFAFQMDLDVLRYLERRGRDGWRLLRSGRPPLLELWYRTSPRRLVPVQAFSGRVSWSDPQQALSGMSAVTLDTAGRLVEWVQVPPQVEAADGAGAGAEAEPDWGPLFEAAGLEAAAFAAAEPTWTPPVFAGARAAWVGRSPELPDEELRIEAAAWRGRPVWFRVIGPWTRAERQQERERTTGLLLNQAIGFTLYVGLLGLALWMARRHVTTGRADRRGAFRLAAAAVALQLVSWLLGSDHVASPASELGMFIRNMAYALFVGASTWVLYVALEPYVRKHQPERVIAWSRLLGGRLRDPMVGRDILIGALLGVAVGVVALAAVPIEGWLGGEGLPEMIWNDSMEGARFAFALLFFRLPDNAFGAMFLFFLWFLLVRLLRREWLANTVVVSLLCVGFASAGTIEWIGLPLYLVIAGLFVVALTRFGLLALIACLVFAEGISNSPLSLDPEAWYAQGGWLVAGLLAAVAVWAFRVALGARPAAAGR